MTNENRLNKIYLRYDELSLFPSLRTWRLWAIEAAIKRTFVNNIHLKLWIHLI